MSFLTSLMKVSILIVFLLQCATSHHVPDRNVEEDDRTDSFPPQLDGRSGRYWLQTRQLGDIEFTNRYAELLKSKAKITSMCSFLKRMLNTQKSGSGGDSERLMLLMKQYSCPNIYQ